MAEKRKGKKYARRDFLKKVATSGAIASTLGASPLAGDTGKAAAGGPRKTPRQNLPPRRAAGCNSRALLQAAT